MRKLINRMNMEIVSIEKKTFDEMMARMGAFVEKVAALQRKGDERRLARDRKSVV